MKSLRSGHCQVKTVALAIFLTWSSGSCALNIPQPPCAISPQPFYADNGKQPNFQVWGKATLASWIPPQCTGWSGGASNVLVAMAGTFSHAGSADDLLKRFGAVSTTRSIRYWSVMDKEWRALVTEAAALSGSNSKDRRPDFSAPEMKLGRDLFLVQRDGRSTGEVIYRMRVRETSADRLVLELENVTPMRKFIVTVFKPGGMKLLYFMERRDGENWGFYVLLSANSSYAEGNEGSYINRAAAFYRHFTGVLTDGAPPLAR